MLAVVRVVDVERPYCVRSALDESKGDNKSNYSNVFDSNKRRRTGESTSGSYNSNNALSNANNDSLPSSLSRAFVMYVISDHECDSYCC